MAPLPTISAGIAIVIALGTVVWSVAQMHASVADMREELAAQKVIIGTLSDDQKDWSIAQKRDQLEIKAEFDALDTDRKQFIAMVNTQLGNIIDKCGVR